MLEDDNLLADKYSGKSDFQLARQLEVVRLNLVRAVDFASSARLKEALALFKR